MTKWLIAFSVLFLTLAVASQPCAASTIAIDQIGEGHVPGPNSGHIQTGAMTLQAGDTIVEICTNYVGTGDQFTTNQFSQGGVNTLTPLSVSPNGNPSIGGGTTVNIGIWYCINCAAESSNPFGCQTSPNGSSNYLSMAVYAFKNVPSTASIDIAKLTNVASTTNPTYAPGINTAQANEAVIAGISGPGGSGVATEDGTYTNGTNTYNISSVLALNTGYKILTSVQAPSYSPHTGSATEENMFIITIKDAVAGGASTKFMFGSMP